MTDRSPFTVLDLEAMETNGNWHLARRSLQLEAFGLNAVRIAPGDQIPEHDETSRDQEEVFLTLEGQPAIIVDGEEIALPPSTFARVDPEVTRTVVNRGDGDALVLIASAPRTSGYEPMGWA